MRGFYTPILYLISFSVSWGVGISKRGPHHPHSEISSGRPQLDEHFDHEPEHIQEDLKNQLIDEKKVNEMDEDEKNFYYFKLHDVDNNDALDGLELLQAATHHKHGISEDSDNEMNHIIEIIDDFISFADVNNNGYLDYAEYATAVAKASDSSTKPIESLP